MTTCRDDGGAMTALTRAATTTSVILSRRSRRKIRDARPHHASAAKDGRRTPYFLPVGDAKKHGT
jgi:hypothetical protein